MTPLFDGGTPDAPSSTRHAPLRLRYNETRVLNSLTLAPQKIEELSAVCGFGFVTVRSVLGELAEKGLVSGSVGFGYTLPTSLPVRARQGNRHDIVEDRFAVLCGDAEERLSWLPDSCADLIVTSSPYYKQRDYGVAGQIGWEPTSDVFVSRIVAVLAQCSRILRPHGLMFFNFDDGSGDPHAGKQECCDAKIMARLDEAGFNKFRTIIWHKTCSQPNGNDRAPNHVFEMVFVLKKPGASHYWDAFSAREEAKNGGYRRLTDIWDIAPDSKSDHIAPFPQALVQRCIEVGVSDRYCSACGAPWKRGIERISSSWKDKFEYAGPATANGKVRDGNVRDKNGHVICRMKMADMKHVGWTPSCRHRAKAVKALIVDPFCGDGTTGIVATRFGNDFLGIDLNPDSVKTSATAIRRTITKPAERLSVSDEKGSERV